MKITDSLISFRFYCLKKIFSHEFKIISIDYCSLYCPHCPSTYCVQLSC